MNIGSLFSGIGGFEIAFTAAGFDVSWQVEIDPFCRSVLAQHFPNATRYSDVYDCHDLPYVDVITAGFPCQPFSLAGKRQGNKDERFLVPEMLRVISEVMPRVVLLENVPGFPSLNDGTEFKRLLRALADLGYDAEWGHLRASDTGAPHRRERWFCVAYHPRPRLSGMGGTSGVETNGEVFDSGFIQRGEMGNANKQYGNRWRFDTSTISQFGSSNLCDCIDRDVESRLGRNINGLSYRLDSPQWPARPGHPQAAWEPPRTTAKKEDRAARLRALGNAVVPQVVYPLALAIREYLEATEG